VEALVASNREFKGNSSLVSRIALVTGGGTGLGLEIARAFARRGADLALVSRDPKHLEQGRSSLEPDLGAGGRVVTASCDVRDVHGVRRAVRGIEEQLGPIDILVNNAAGNFIRPSLKLAPKGWRAVIDIALTGVFYCSQAAGRVMVEQGSGVIVNVTAPYAETGMPGVIHSVCAKAGVNAMTKTLAAEWGPLGVRVNAISPGPFHSQGAQVRLWPTEELENQMRESVPLKRFGETGEVADGVVWLCSPAAAYCNGTILAMDGGWLLGGAGLDVNVVRRDRE
jgi:NAD(P)-dependent dehydrogenase (short-subunit alcohol dehydrogenase family)